MREKLVERGESTAAIDRRIQVERVRVMRAEIDRPATPERAATMEITASRKAPKEQSARIIYDDKGKAASKKAVAGSRQPKAESTGKGAKE